MSIGGVRQRTPLLFFIHVPHPVFVLEAKLYLNGGPWMFLVSEVFHVKHLKPGIFQEQIFALC